MNEWRKVDFNFLNQFYIYRYIIFFFLHKLFHLQLYTINCILKTVNMRGLYRRVSGTSIYSYDKNYDYKIIFHRKKIAILMLFYLHAEFIQVNYTNKHLCQFASRV